MQPHFKNLKSIILNEISLSKKSIKIAVAWFTDKDILKVIIEKRKEGVHVIAVISNDEKNFTETYSLDYEPFKLIGGVLIVINKSFMHHKFTIIDEEILITGTANYTYNGFNKNSENIMVINDPTTVSEFLLEFNALTDFYVLEANITLSNYSQKLEIEIKWALNQIDFLEHDLAQAEKVIDLYEVKYRLRFRVLILEILQLQKLAYKKKYNQTEKIEDKKRFEKAQVDHVNLSESEFNDKSVEDQSNNIETQRCLKELFREAVKLCHPDNAFISDELKAKANQLFIRLKTAYTNNNLELVKSILADLKSGIALGNTEYKSMNNDSLEELLDSLKVKIQELVERIYSIKNDTKYFLGLDENALEVHFSEQELLLVERLRSLK
jgi:hypothetical protein